MKKKTGISRSLLAALALFAVMILGSICFFRAVDRRSFEAETESVEKDVHSALRLCYAVEGFYPDDLDYLCTHYGLTWDDELYIIVYDAFASNIMPDVSVIVKGGDAA